MSDPAVSMRLAYRRRTKTGGDRRAERAKRRFAGSIRLLGDQRE